MTLSLFIHMGVILWSILMQMRENNTFNTAKMDVSKELYTYLIIF